MCSTASGPAPRWAAPAASPCQHTSIRSVSRMICWARSSYTLASGLTWCTEVTRPRPSSPVPP
ncbi:MAG: hypothetical protein GEV28_38050 [Actinophytocola sp.]|nr:hypothetical protein [Actinophytocola sp.]